MSNDKKHIIDPSVKKLLDLYEPNKGMEVPEGYFNQLPDLVLNRINEEDIVVNKPGLRVLFMQSPIWKGAVAACIIIMMSIATLNIINYSQGEDFLANVSEEHGWQYILDISDEYGIDDFAELPEMEEAINTLESELYGINISDDFIDDIEFEIVEDLFK